MRLNRRHQGSDRRRSSIVNERLETGQNEQLSERMQKAIADTRQRIGAAFADGKKMNATLKESSDTR